MVRAFCVFKIDTRDRVDRRNISRYFSLMKKASITETKNHLSRLLEEVKSGTTILILDRNKPVARLEPVAADQDTNDERVAVLIRQGLATAFRRRLNVASFLARKMAHLPEGTSAVRALLSEREEGR